jgi:hypothetical protein
MATLTDWNFYDRNVQSGLTEGQFINSNSIFLGAGPPFLQSTSTAVRQRVTESILPNAEEDLAVPEVTEEAEIVFGLGTTQQFAMSQNTAMIPVTEIGSYQRYIVRGNTDGGAQLQKILVHGPSILRALHAYKGIKDPSSAGGVFDPLIRNSDATYAGYPKNRLFESPGHENFWINLASDVFTAGFGLLVYIEDSGVEGYGAFYLEQVFSNAHQFSFAPGQTVVAESVSCMFGRVRPVKLTRAVPLIGRSDTAGRIALAGGPNTLPQDGLSRPADSVNRAAPGGFAPIPTRSNR